MRRLVCLLVLVGLLYFSGEYGTAAGQEIGVAWVGKSGMANRVIAGFEETIDNLAPGIQVETRRELATMDELSEVVSAWQKNKDGMVILRSNGAKWLGKNPPTIPTFIGGCNNPIQLGVLKDMDAPEGNVTGVTYFLPVKTSFEVFQALIPNLNSVLLLLEKGHPGGAIDQQGTREICAQLGIEYHESICGSVEEISGAVNQWKQKVSAIIIGSQAMVMDETASIVAAAGSTPVVSYSSKPVKVGALGGFVADDHKLGKQLAESVVAVLVNGLAIKNVPVKIDTDPHFYVNVTTAEQLAVEIPYEILSTATVINTEADRLGEK